MHTKHAAAAAVQVANDVAYIITGNKDIIMINRLNQCRRRLCASFLISQASCGFKRHFLGIHGMVFAEVKRCLEACHGVAGKHALAHRFPRSLFNRGDVFLGHHAAHDRVHELEFFAIRQRLKAHVDHAELAAAARLLLMFAFCLGSGTDGFTVWNARVSKLCFHVGFVLKLCTNNIKVNLAQSGKQYIAGFSVLFKRNGGIFFQQLVEACKHLILFTLLLRAYRKADAGAWELDRFKLHRR